MHRSNPSSVSWIDRSLGALLLHSAGKRRLLLWCCVLGGGQGVVASLLDTGAMAEWRTVVCDAARGGGGEDDSARGLD
jgi:hypothetical protein